MKKTLILAALAMLCACTPKSGLVLHYDFSKVSGGIVKDVTGNGYDAALKGSATVVTLADGTTAVDLRDGDGWLDLGPAIGAWLSKAEAFSIEVKYNVADTASLRGNGFFLWAFSSLEQNTREEGHYHAYKLNVQRAENSASGWNHETGIEIGRQSVKGQWRDVLYTQDGHQARLYFDGELVGSNDEMMSMSETYDAAPQFNWMGRAPFRGDRFLAGITIADVKIFDKAVEP